MKLQLIIGSVQNGRRGEMVAKWVYGEISKLAKKYRGSNEEFELELVDLKEWNLPPYQEPTPEIAQKWIDKIAEADGYILVTPEYNHGYPASVKDAFDYPYKEWNRKPIAFVGYSTGIGGGIRSIEQLRQVVIELQMAPIRTAVYFPQVETNFVDGKPADDKAGDKLNKFLDDLVWWTKALKNARES